GNFSAQLACNWGGGTRHDETSVEGQIDVEELLFTAAALGTDRLEVEKLTAPCRIIGSGEELKIEQLQLDCDLGKFNVTGDVRLADVSVRNLAAALVRESSQI